MDQKRLREYLEYRPETGEFIYRGSFFKSKNGKAVRAGIRDGYKIIRIDGRTYNASRLAWLYMTGKFPEEQVDHIDRDRSNDRWCNLREASRSENKANCAKRSDSTSPYKGVSWMPRQRKWQATVTKDGRRNYLGYFKTAHEAHQAYLAAAKAVFGEYARG